jgi:hypothetical protein
MAPNGRWPFIHVQFMCRSPLVLRNLTAVTLCDTQEQSSPPDSRRRFSRSPRHPRTPAGVIVVITDMLATMRAAAIMGGVAITVATPALSVAPLSVR